jgi:hypothetical protein
MKEVNVKRIAWFLAAVVVAMSLGFGAGINAASKSYQFTGTVKASDAGTLTVQKSATETWQFDTNKDTKGTAKVGDKVTVYYTMVATQIESKPAAAAPTAGKKPAAK